MRPPVANWFGARESWELFTQNVDEAEATLWRNRVPQLDQRCVDSLEVRLVNGGRLGSSSCSRWRDLPACVRSARRSARQGPPNPLQFAPQQHYLPVSNFDEELAATGPFELAQWLEQILMGDGARWIPDLCASARREIVTRRLVNHNGVDVEHASTRVSVSLSASTGDGFDVMRTTELSCRLDLDLKATLEAFEQQCCRCTRSTARTAPARSDPPAAFSERAVAALLQLFEDWLVTVMNTGSRDHVESRREPLVAESIHLNDPGTQDWMPGSAPFDDEGVPKQAASIITAGWLKSSILDLQSAQATGAEPTGHAWRLAGSAPVPRFNNPLLAPGTVPIDDMVADLRDGLWIENLKQPHLTTGEGAAFEAEVDAGFVVAHGRPRGPVRKVRIAGDLLRLLGSGLLAIANTTRRVQWGTVPALTVRQIDVQW